MQCPTCSAETQVLETRSAEGGSTLRRRRRCKACERRFTTFERREREPAWVTKRGGERRPFDQTKLRAGLMRAAHKRPVSPEQIEAIVDRISGEIERAGGELDSQRVGELCLAGLRELDLGAYLQFATVYRQLADVDALREELGRLGAPVTGVGEGVFAGASGVERSSFHPIRRRSSTVPPKTTNEGDR